MKKERTNMRLITNDTTDIKTSDIKIAEPIEDKVYQSNQLKTFSIPTISKEIQCTGFN